MDAQAHTSGGPPATDSRRLSEKGTREEDKMPEGSPEEKDDGRWPAYKDKAQEEAEAPAPGAQEAEAEAPAPEAKEEEAEAAGGETRTPRSRSAASKPTRCTT